MPHKPNHVQTFASLCTLYIHIYSFTHRHFHSFWPTVSRPTNFGSFCFHCLLKTPKNMSVRQEQQFIIARIQNAAEIVLLVQVLSALQLFLLVSGSSSTAASQRLELSNTNVGPMFGLAYNKRRTYIDPCTNLGNILDVSVCPCRTSVGCLCLRKYFYHSMSFHMKQMSAHLLWPTSDGICKKVIPFFVCDTWNDLFTCGNENTNFLLPPILLYCHLCESIHQMRLHYSYLNWRVMVSRESKEFEPRKQRLKKKKTKYILIYDWCKLKTAVALLQFEFTLYSFIHVYSTFLWITLWRPKMRAGLKDKNLLVGITWTWSLSLIHVAFSCSHIYM